MQLVEEGQPIMGFGLCFICETACDRRFGIVNTRYQFDPEFHSPLVGPKYVCEHCVRAMADLFGLVDSALVAAQEAEATKQREDLKRIKSQVNSLSRQLSSATKES